MRIKNLHSVCIPQDGVPNLIVKGKSLEGVKKDDESSFCGHDNSINNSITIEKEIVNSFSDV